MNERLLSAIAALLCLADDDVAFVEAKLPMIRLTVRDFEDEGTSLGTVDLQDEGLVEATLSEMDDDLEKLLGGG